MKSTTLTLIFLFLVGWIDAQTGPTFLGSSSYPVSSNCGNGNQDEHADFVLPTSDGGYLMVGSYECGFGDWDGRVIKVNSTGTVVWEVKSGGTGYDFLRSAVELSDGYVVVGEYEYNGLPTLWVRKYTLAGGFVWGYSYSNPTNPSWSQSGFTVTTTYGGNIIVGGAYAGFVTPLPIPTPPNQAGRVWVIDQNGNMINNGVDAGGYVVLKIEKSSDNSSYYVFGEQFDNTEQACASGPGVYVVSNLPYGFNSFSGYYSDVRVDKLNSQLVSIWVKTFGGVTPDGFIDGIATPDGGFALIASTNCIATNGNSGQNNVASFSHPWWMLKGNSNGNLTWVEAIGFNFVDAVRYPFALSNTCDANYVVGFNSNGLLGSSIAIDKFNPQPGVSFWTSSSTLIQSTQYGKSLARTSDNKFAVVADVFPINNGINNDFGLYRWNQDPGCNPCANAESISCGIKKNGDTTNGASNFNAANYAGCYQGSSNFSGPDKIYSVIKSSNSGDLVVNLFSQGIDHDIFLFNPCNGTTMTCIGASINSVDPVTGLNQEVIRIPNAASGTYYIVVDGDDASQQGQFTLTVTCGNLSCAGAWVMTCGAILNGQSNTTGTNNVSAYCGQNGTGPGGGCTGLERVYTFSLTQQQSVTIDLTGVDSNEDFELFLFGGCNQNNCIASSTNSYGVNEHIATTLPPGQYYIVVDGWHETSGLYNLSLSCCPTPTYNFNCGTINYTQAGGTNNPLQYTFTSTGQTMAPGYTWQVGTAPSNYQNVMGATTPTLPYLFSSTGTYDVCFPIVGTSGCVEYCCRKYCIAPPVNCEGSIQYSYSNNQMVFNLQNASQYTGITWAWDDAPTTTLPSSGGSVSVNIPSQCIARTISVRYFDGSCWRICCRKVWLCNPFDCYDFTYNFVSSSNGFKFELGLTGASSISWNNDSAPQGQQDLGSGATSNILPVPGSCISQTITVRYFYNGSWRICCRKVWLCNPFDCYDFTYSYVSSSNGFKFELGLTGASSISWNNDSAPQGQQDLGSGTTSNILPVPGSCVSQTITVRYFYNGSWRICCRTIYLCNPFYCGTITPTYVVNQGYFFSIPQGNYDNITWKVDQTGQDLGSNSTTTSIPLPPLSPPNCDFRDISVSYHDPAGYWRICCIRVWVCNPTACSGTITPSYDPNGSGSTTLQVNSNYQEVTWFNGNNQIGAVNPLTVVLPPGTSPTIYVRYKEPGSGCYYYCCRTLNIPPPCVPVASFTSSTSGSTVTFTNTSTGNPTSSWNFGDGGTSSLSNPTHTYAPGAYNCCLTVSNSCGTSQQFCLPINISCPLPVAMFTPNTSGSTVIFTNTSTGSPTSYSWNFGDGGTSTLPNPTHTYAPGAYTCCLTASNTCGTSQQYCLPINIVCPLPVASYTYTLNNGVASFTSTSTGSPTSYAWNFGDGGTSSLPNPTHTFVPGTYTCCLTASNSCGTSQPYCPNITINIITPPGWNFEQTGKSHTIIAPINLVSNINGQSLMPGDLIGCFYMNNGNQFCAGYGQWIGTGNIAFQVYGNEAIAPNKNGFAPGEIFKVKVWRAAQQVTIDVQATYTPPDGTLITDTNAFANGGTSQLKSLVGNSTLDINLANGWNMISSYVTPTTTSLEDVFASIQNKIVQVKDGSGNSYIPSLNINQIGNWNTIKGYQVKTSSAVTLTITGQKADPTTTPIALTPTWQIIAYLRDNESPITTQFGSIASSIVQVKNGTGQSYIPSLNINQIGNLKPTQGYQLKASAATTFVYTANLLPGGQIEDRATLQAPRFFDLNGLNTGENATIVIPKIALVGMMEGGDEIGIFSQDGILCGAASYVDENFAVTIWGDDPTTPDRKEGLTEGELFFAKIMKANHSDVYYYLLELESGQPAYRKDEIYLLNHILQCDARGKQQPVVFIQPNPASDQVKLVIYGPHSSELLLTLHSQDGAWRKEIFQGEFNGGVMEHEFSVSDLPAGMYFCTARFNDQVLTYRIVVQH